MKTHELKTVQPHFENVRSGVKRAEIRRDDRGFAVGDVLVLREYDAATDSYSGREVEVRVTHVLAGYEALAPGFVMLSIEPQPSALATARAEAALAEREACAQWFEDRAASYERRATLVAGNPASFGGAAVAEDVVESLTTAGAQARLDARTIRARTTPDTLSTDTLAAIAEARGLRVVEPELVAEVPVLQWECDLHSIARFGQWVLEADAEAWAVWVDSPGPAARLLVAEATTERTERAVNRSAAEDALRKLGVAFRTE